jgi:hypothetical protein
MQASSNGASGTASGSPANDPELLRARQNVAANSTANAGSKARAGNTRATQANGAVQNIGLAGNKGSGGIESRTNTYSGGNHGKWLTVGVLSLPGQIASTMQHPVPENYASTSIGATLTVAEFLALANKTGSGTLNGIYNGAMGFGTAAGTGLDVYETAMAGIDFAGNPDSEQAKWDLANATVHLAGNGAAILLMPLSAAVGFGQLALPNFSEVGRAVQLSNQEVALRKKVRIPKQMRYTRAIRVMRSMQRQLPAASLRCTNNYSLRISINLNTC